MAPLLSFEVDMSTPPTDRLVANARIGPDDTPHEAATHRLHPWWARRTVAAAAHRTTPASMPAVVGTLGAVAAVVTSAVVLGAGVAPLPEPPLPQPVVVDEDPGLPSDEEPSEGWPSPPAVVDGAPVAGGSGPAEPTDEPTDLVDGLTGTIEDTTDPLTEPLTDPVQDVVEGVTDTAEEIVDEVTDTVEDAVDEVTDTLDELP